MTFQRTRDITVYGLGHILLQGCRIVKFDGCRCTFGDSFGWHGSDVSGGSEKDERCVLGWNDVASDCLSSLNCE